MKAARFYAKGDVKVEEIDVPKQKDGEVLIEITWCGICGSDLHEYIIGRFNANVCEIMTNTYLGPMTIPSAKEHPLTGEKLPVTLGHEFCGRIKEAPSGSKFKAGQAVVVDPRLYCRSCNRCNIQDTVTCDQWGFRGLSGGGGGFSQFVSAHESQVYAIPDELLPFGALVEPLAVAWHAVKRVPYEDFSDKSALIVGGGPIGIALVLVLKAFGIKNVIVSEPTAARRKQNEELADHVLNPIDQNVGDECRKLTNGEGVDITFDAAGVPRGLHAGVDALKFKGWYINVAGWEEPVSICTRSQKFKADAISDAIDDDPTVHEGVQLDSLESIQ